MNAHERPIVTEDNKTAMRAGATGNNVRYVLIGSVALGNPCMDPCRVLRQAVSASWSPTGQTTGSRLCVARRRLVRPVLYGKTRPRPCSERDRRTLKSCLSASSLGIGKTLTVVRSSGRRDSCWTGLWLEAGVDRERVYVTNAVKHFKFEPRGKRRLHKRPNASEIKICRHWLFDEIEAIGPRLIVALGATAAQSLAGRAIPVQTNRGKILDVDNGLRVFMTIHPSALLRLQDEEEKRSGYASFVNDLRSIERFIEPPEEAKPASARQDSFSF